MKKFIVRSTRWVKNGRKVGYFRDKNELIETDDIVSYIHKNYNFVLGCLDKKKRTFCSAVEVEDVKNSYYRYVDKVGGIKVNFSKECGIVEGIVEKTDLISRYDISLKGWL